MPLGYAQKDSPRSAIRLPRAVQQSRRWAGQPPVVPLKFREWAELEGGEERRQVFETDYADLIAGRASAVQGERITYAFDSEDD